MVDLMKSRTRMMPSFKRLRKSPNFGAIHALIAEGKPLSEVVHQIQQGWREMLDVRPETLEKQLQRYKSALKVGGKAPHERVAPAAPTGSWASTRVVPKKVEEEAVVVKEGEGAIEEGGTENGVEKGSIPQAYDVHGSMVQLFELQMKRIALDVGNENMSNKLLPGTGLEVSVARDILKTIHVIEGDLGIRHQEPHKVGVGVMVGLTPALQDKLNDKGVLGILQDKKSRKRILNALSAGSALGAGTNFPKMSEETSEETEKIIDVEVIENTDKKAEEG